MVTVPSVLERVDRQMEMPEARAERLGKEIAAAKEPLRVTLSKRHRTAHYKVSRQLLTYCGNPLDKVTFLVKEDIRLCSLCERGYREQQEQEQEQRKLVAAVQP